MQNSKQIAQLVGPALVALTASESPLVQPHLYDKQIPPVVYLSGALFFIAGLSIVRIHNHWTRNWTVLVTITGWLALVLGLFRMFAADAYQQGAQSIPLSMIALELLGLLIGIFITFKAYSGER